MIETARLLLRPWQHRDKASFAAMVNTPAMMEHFGGPTSRAALDALIDAQIAQQDEHGHSMWAVETRADGQLAGICGVRIGGHPGTPVPRIAEIGWRIAERWWGCGLAREAAAASLAWTWANTSHPAVAAWTSAGNHRSWGLMVRLGMERRAALDFRHPAWAGNDDPRGDMIVYVADRPRTP